jgi:hypothetical protein
MDYKNFRILALAVIAIPLCLLCSCNGEKKDGGNADVNLNGPLMTLDSQDTIIVDQLSTEFIEHLKNNEYEDAVSMLYYLHPDSSIVPLPRNMAIRQEQIFRTFPVLDYQFESIRFRTETDCQVKFNIVFSRNAEGKDYTTSLYLQPIRRDGQWYLTVRDSSSPAGSVSQIEN